MSADAEDADHLPPPPSNPNGKRNAFSELMSANRKQPAPRHPQTPMTRNPNPNGPRSGLLAYITDPAAHSEMRVINYDSSFVLIKDLFPKATTHLLLLPRDPSKYLLHPHDAFADPVFLASVKSAAATAARLAAKELERLLLPFSASSQPRLKALESAEPPDALPEGREWSAEIRVGIHAHPSMSHLHIHILSRDMHSECLKHRKHYNSFNTDFFIPLADYPLAEDDVRRDVGYQNRNLKRDFKCWRCGTEFGNRFKELKGHLEREFDEWKRE